MLTDVNYVIWGVAFDATIAVLLGVLVISVIRLMKHNAKMLHHRHGEPASLDAQLKKDREALMNLMNHKTDSMLAALAVTIEQERQKLGVIVRNPSINEEIDARRVPVPKLSERPVIDHERILSLAQKGTAIPVIARQMKLSEAEVSLIMRFKAA